VQGGMEKEMNSDTKRKRNKLMIKETDIQDSPFYLSYVLRMLA
jgi:hypothetical protein